MDRLSQLGPFGCATRAVDDARPMGSLLSHAFHQATGVNLSSVAGGVANLVVPGAGALFSQQGSSGAPTQTPAGQPAGNPGAQSVAVYRTPSSNTGLYIGLGVGALALILLAVKK